MSNETFRIDGAYLRDQFKAAVRGYFRPWAASWKWLRARVGAFFATAILVSGTIAVVNVLIYFEPTIDRFVRTHPIPDPTHYLLIAFAIIFVLGLSAIIILMLLSAILESFRDR